MADTPHPEALAEGSTQADNAVKTPVYEVGFHLVPTVGDEGVGPAVEKIRTALDHAEVISEGYPQKMTVAYTIERAAAGRREKYTETYFGWVKFATEREHIPAIEEKLRGMRDILRYILIETVREDISTQPRRAVFTSDRLEGETIKKTPRTEEKGGEVSEAELDKSIEALTG
jgi:ribosomal protein S6